MAVILGCRDNLDKLSGNDGLSGSVEGNPQLVNHLGSILGGVVHGSHPRALFRGGTLFQSIENQTGQAELHVRLHNIGIQRIVYC